MKLLVSNRMLPFETELERIFSLFKEQNDELLFEATSENELEKESQNLIKIDFQYSLKGNLVKSSANTIVKNQKYSQMCDKSLTENTNVDKVLKQVISTVFLRLLEKLSGETHAWGILTGIRPTKLYHKLYQELNSHNDVKEVLKEEYLLRDEKIKLLQEIAKRQLEVIPNLYKMDEELSLYIGIPFCPTKCAYCTFPAYAIQSKIVKVEDFLKTLLSEIDRIGQWIKSRSIKVTTIYFGGGTPTSIEADQLNRIFEALNRWIDLKKVKELTVEAGRPDTITIEKLKVLRNWNVDRISINPQTFTQETLDIIGRHHTVKETIDKYKLARECGIQNINMDLIIGLPGEKLEHMMNSLQQIEKMQPESLTIHTMAFKRASFLTKNREEFEITEKEEVANMMEYSQSWTTNQHYLPYYLYRQKNMLGNLENIGYAKLGMESLYNILIMEEKQTILGLGSGAVSKIIAPGGEQLFRIPNPKDPKTYVENIDEIINKKLGKLNEIFETKA